MAKLVLSSGGTIVHQCFLDQEQLGIGREASNAIVVDDPTVSREHAMIVQVGNDHVLTDLHSDQGTFVNGARVERHILQHGDIVEFGAFNLRYLNARASAESDMDRTMLITGLRMTPDAQDEAPAPAHHVHVPAGHSGRTRFPKGRVKMQGGARAGSVIELDRVVVTFGKAGEQLAVVTRRPHGYFITHVEGRRYPRVNRETIGSEARLLHNGDTIEVGDERLAFVQD
jgi:FHA domain